MCAGPRAYGCFLEAASLALGTGGGRAVQEGVNSTETCFKYMVQRKRGPK